MSIQQLAQYNEWLKGKQLHITSVGDYEIPPTTMSNLCVTEQGKLCYLTASREYKSLPQKFSRDEMLTLLSGKKVERSGIPAKNVYQIK